MSRPDLLVAVCFSGQARTIERCYPSLRANLFNRLPEYRIFCHAADDADKDKLALLNPTAVSIGDRPVAAALDPRVERMVDGIFAWTGNRGWGPGGTFHRILNQWNSWSLSHALKTHYEREHSRRFDWVIRVRYDDLLETPIEDVRILDPSRVYAPANGNYFGINDHFGFGSSANMDVYANLIHAVPGYAASGKPFRLAEEVLGYHLRQHGIAVSRTEVRVSIARLDGSIERLVYWTAAGDAPCPRGSRFRNFWMLLRLRIGSVLRLLLPHRHFEAVGRFERRCALWFTALRRELRHPRPSPSST